MSSMKILVVTCSCLLMLMLQVVSASDYNKNFAITWGDGRAKMVNNRKHLALSLDKYSGSGFQSKNSYLFLKVDMQIKLVPGNSAGTVTTFFLSSLGANHDEIDFEFLGNATGEPYTIHTNVFCQGKGNREQQFKLWFDPTKDFHTYSIAWTRRHIMFSIDGTAIRRFKNQESIGVPFPNSKPMRIFASLWNADDWATQGGRVKTDWEKAPFMATYGAYTLKGCKWTKGKSSCTTSTATTASSSSSNVWMDEEMDSSSQDKINWVEANHMIYDYCKDTNRFPEGVPPECNA
ncbi:uncharacterized protein [Phyllobates terribilis]|uniref:uncharacterized protein n=1 Tax=Phyllobates terribilis TaxID=111132 RepID=UPI003CCAB19A